jgi:TDG/mug DNA glycosylase family protein
MPQNKPQPANRRRATAYSHLRLADRLEPGVRVLFVGINPGVRSAVTGHHFAGFSNRFWKLLWDARLVPEQISHEDDDRLPQWGCGITNLIPRPSPGIDDLRPQEYVDGWHALDAKVRRFRPPVVALVGVTLYRAIRPLLGATDQPRGAPIRLGEQEELLHGARIFVLPNPSGRNANFTYEEMLAAFRQLRTFLKSRRAGMTMKAARR